MKRVLTLMIIMLAMTVSVVFADNKPPHQENITLIQKDYNFWKSRHQNQKVPFVGYIQFNTEDFDAGNIRVTVVDSATIKDALIEKVDKTILNRWISSAHPEKISELGDGKVYLPFIVSVLTVIKGSEDPIFQYVRMSKVN